VGASYVVRAVMNQTFQVQLPIILDPLTIVSGLLIGLATALIFGLLPIVEASQIRPLAVLRESPEGTRATSRLTTLILLALLSLLFVALASTILGDIVTAAIAVYGGAVGIFILGLGLGLLVAAISRLPVYERPNPRILLWILAALGGVILALLSCGLLLVLGGSANLLATHLGNSTLGIYLLAIPGGLGIMLIGASLVFFLATLLDSVVMFAPRAWKTAVMLAYRNIGRQRIRTATTLTALFVGVFAIGLVLILGQGIKDTITTTLSTLFTRNVFVVVPPKQQEAVATQLPQLAGIDGSKTVINALVPQIYPLFIGGRDLNTVVQSIHSKDKISKEGLLGSLGNLEGFKLHLGGDNIPTITLKEGRNLGPADTGTTNVVVNARLQIAPVRLRVGDTIIVQSADGTITKELRVVGFYDNTDPTGNPNFASILADEQVATQLGGSSTLEVFSLKVDPDQLPGFKRELNHAVPGAIVISIVDIDALINQVLNNLIIMLTTIASLAMIAGLIIIANAVALAMLERRREIGILKAVGYTSKSVLATVLIENGLVGLLGSLIAMLLVAGAITILSKFVFQVQLTLAPGLIALMIAATSLTTMLVAALVAWNAVRVRPLEVLRYE
ncbi:MAG TPA: FtsX-like permease family protein, partial [Ktedonosporobacter sp.]|nr:FtsX-like permease family protein [Ktedonosporobacter sp.]